MPLFPPVGMERLGSNKLASAGTSVGAITIPPRDLLFIWVAINGYGGGGDIGALQFNADTTATNYGSRMVYLNATASATLTNQSNNGTIARIPCGPTAVTTGRTAMAFVNNHSQNAVKPITMIADVAQTTAATEINVVPCQIWGQYNTGGATTLITQVNLITPSANMSTGSGFIVYGANI